MSVNYFGTTRERLAIEKRYYLETRERLAIDKRYARLIAEEQRKFIQEEKNSRQRMINLWRSNEELDREMESIKNDNQLADFKNYIRTGGLNRDPNLRPTSAELWGDTFKERIHHGTQRTRDAEEVARILMSGR